ncbi:serine/threonine protein kinase [Dongshaea marina]|uniref:serine/threonine protein kinase n=1 Tax=Dongshaea marina TaxID=2047966 RepID=UPI000D3E3948|nr:serine/threonine protein kinase [Dongshaea marina]
MPEIDPVDYGALSPELILDAIESCGIRVESGLLALNSYENRVYQFHDESQRYVVKFYRPQRWSDAQILEEHQLSWQATDAELPVAAPLVLNGKTLQQYQGYRFAIWNSLGGRSFEVDNLDQLEWAGRYLGRFHLICEQQPFIERPAIDCASYLHGPRAYLEQQQLVPKELQQAFFAALDPVIERAEQQFGEFRAIRLHGDCHPGNILWRDGPLFVDLDDCRMGPAIQDLWMLLSGDDRERRLQLDVILEEYEMFREFDRRELALIEPLRALRMVHYMGWLARRWSDPAFPVAFPWFGSMHYWEGQILALKEQLSDLQESCWSSN